jgi:hypothetical protein
MKMPTTLKDSNSLGSGTTRLDMRVAHFVWKAAENPVTSSDRKLHHHLREVFVCKGYLDAISTDYGARPF